MTLRDLGEFASDVEYGCLLVLKSLSRFSHVDAYFIHQCCRHLAPVIASQHLLSCKSSQIR